MKRLLCTLSLGAVLLAACGGSATPSSPAASTSVAPASASAAPSVATSASAAASASASAPASASASPSASTSASASSAASPAAGSKLTIGLSSMPIGMDPTGSLATPDFYGEALVFDALTAFDFSKQPPELKPGLALSWTAKDATTWEFKLRPNVKFQNGDAFTADDVKFTFDREMDPANKLPTLSRVATFKEVKVIDPMTVDIITKSTDPTLPRNITALFIVPQKYFTSVGAAAFNTQKPVGTGWYRVSEYSPKISLTLQAYNEGWHGAAKTQQVALKGIPENAARVAALKSGDIDMANGLGTDQMASVKQTDNLVTSTSGMMNAVYMQSVGSKAGPMTDKRVREAMIQAVDRDSIATNILGGVVPPAQESIPPTVNGFNPNVKQLPYDVNKAKALLAEAGVKGFSTSVGTTYGALVDTQQTMEAYVGMESKIGVDVKINNLDIATFLQDFRTFNRPPLWNMSLGWNPTLDAQSQLQWFVSTKGPDKFLNDPQFDKLYNQAAQELDQAKRTQLLQQAEAELVSQAVGVWFYETPAIYGLAKNIQGFTPRPDQVIDTFAMSKG